MGRRGAGGRPRTLLPVLCAVLALALLPADGTGQLRRDPAVPYVPDADGRLLLGFGVAREVDRSFPLSGLRGDLDRLGVTTLLYSFAPGAVFHVQGDAYRVLSVESRGPSRVPLDEGVADGTTGDAGDFRLGTLFRVLGSARGFSGGLHLAATLPNSDEEKGIGTNTTDVRTSVFGSWGRRGVRMTGELGIGILEAPLADFSQNDVVVYAGEALYRPPASPVGISLSARGRASTRDLVPPGTEDRGRLRVRGELRLGPWRVDGGVSRGYAGPGADWILEIGGARLVP